MRRADLAGAAITIALLGCAGGYIEPLPAEAQRYRARTNDGWELALTRYVPAEASGRPVLLCHGISANSRHMDLDRNHSLARWLAGRGREAWTLSLRGTGESDGIDPGKGRPPGFDFDTLWKEDLPAAVGKVREVTGADAVDYVGHSMGGMILYAYLSQGGGGIHRAVTLGSPTRFKWGGRWAGTLIRNTRSTWQKEDAIPVTFVARAFFPLMGELGTLSDAFYNPENVTKETFKRVAAMGLSDISGALALQMVGFMDSGEFRSADGQIDFRRDMAKISVPVLVVAGKLDRVATVPGVKDGYWALGGDKEWSLVGRENGARSDYGHLDLVVGEHAPNEVFAPVKEFLDRETGG